MTHGRIYYIYVQMIVVIIAISVIGTAATASNLNFMKNAPSTYFNQADQVLFKNSVVTTLNETNDGETRAWSNPDTKSSGEIKVLRTLPGQDKCRELQITNRAGGLSNTGRYVFCYETNNDRWVMRPGTK